MSERFGRLPIVATADGDAYLYWPPNRTRSEFGGAPAVQISSVGRVHNRNVWLDLRGLMEAIVADPASRAELEVVLAEARLREALAALKAVA